MRTVTTAKSMRLFHTEVGTSFQSYEFLYK